MALFVATAASVLAGSPLKAADCSSHYARLAGVANFPEVLEQVCPVEGASSSGALKVVFLRLNEPVAGNLAKGEITPEMIKLTGEASVQKNDVFQELVKLFDQFGHQQAYPFDAVNLVLNVKASRSQGNSSWQSVPLAPAKQPTDTWRRFWTITSPFGETTTVSAFLKSADEQIRSSDHWPTGFKQIYTCRNDAVVCTRSWTYLSVADLDALERDTQSQEGSEQAELQNNPAVTPNNGDTSDWPDDRFKSHLPLFRYLAKSGWPQNFLYAESVLGVSECAAETVLFYNYRARPLSLDVAILENASAEPVELMDLVGAKSDAVHLRVSTPQDAASAPSAPLAQPKATIPSKGRLIIPLRIVFLDSTDDLRSKKFKADSDAMFGKIKSGSRSVYSTKLEGATIRKKRASFGEPVFPEAVTFLLGPEINLNGFLLSKQSVPVSSAKSDLITLTRDVKLQVDRDSTNVALQQSIDAGASCPYLYSFVKGEWVKHGKVIHEANSVEKEMTSVVEVDPSAKHFRLTEEEPELATIKRVEMIVTLKNGRRVILKPSTVTPTLANEMPVQLPSNTKIDFQFDVPEFSGDDILKKEIAVTGYYERYLNARNKTISSRISR